MTDPGKAHVVLTSFGSDRPGIVDDLAEWILQADGNIEDSRMSLLAGEFATIMLVSGAVGIGDRLEAGRGEFQERCGLTVFLRPALPRAGTDAPRALIRYNLESTSLDSPGIVHQVARLLRQHAINIVTASSWMSSAPFSGAPVFHFRMEIDLPGEVPVNKLRDELRELGDRLNIDFTLSAAG